MAKCTLKMNQTGGKPRRKFVIVYAAHPDWKEVAIEGDELSNTEGVVEIWTDEKLSAVATDFVFIKEIFQEKTPE